MKVLLLTLLLLLCSTQVLTLTCYVCTNDSPENCKMNTQECSSSDQYCKMVIENDLMTRTCVEFCDEDDFTTCCQTDLCSESDE